jgi:hypothetical protein
MLALKCQYCGNGNIDNGKCTSCGAPLDVSHGVASDVIAPWDMCALCGDRRSNHIPRFASNCHGFIKLLDYKEPPESKISFYHRYDWGGILIMSFVLFIISFCIFMAIYGFIFCRVNYSCI